MGSLTDIGLVAQVAISGNKRAFDELVHRYQSLVRRFFLHQTLGDSQLSDDLAQDTFIKAYTSIASFRGLASFQTWLMRIAYNVFYDYTRRKKMEVSDDLLSTDISHSTSSSSTGIKMDIYAALALLKPDERSCVTLQLIDGYDISGIAKIMQMKEGTVKSHLSRGKEKLANYLKENGYDR